MSAYIVSDRTINRVIGFLEADFRDEYSYAKREILQAAQIDPEDWPSKLGASMALMNDAGVNARYGENTATSDREGDFYEWHRETPSSPIQAVKSLQCFMYQCAEGDVPDCPLYKALRQLEYYILKNIVSNLPDYEKAEWS